MQHSLGMLYFKELFTMVYRVKHAHYLVGMDYKIWESSKWKHVVLKAIEDGVYRKVGLQIF